MEENGSSHLGNRCYNCAKGVSPDRTCFSDGDCPKFEPAEDIRIEKNIGLMPVVRILTKKEAAEYRKLKPGVTQTAEMIQQVAIHEGHLYILETTASGFNRIIVRL